MITEKQMRYINYLFKTKKWADTIVCTYDLSRINHFTKNEASCLITDLLRCDDEQQ